MLALLFATVVSIATPRIEASTGEHRIVLNAKMREAVRRFDPTFQIFRDADFPQVLALSYEYTSRQAPFAAIGDFNGDGRDDVVLAGRTSSGPLFLAVLSEKNGYHAAPMSDAVRPDDEMLPETDPRERGIGTFIVRVAKRGQRVVPIADVEPFRLRHDAVETEYFEKAWQLWFVKNGRFVSVVTGD